MEDKATSMYKSKVKKTGMDKEVDTYCAWSFGLGLGSLLTSLPVLSQVAAVVGIVLGIKGLGRLNADKMLKGRWMAVTGIVLSSVQLFLTLLVLIFLFFTVAAAV